MTELSLNVYPSDRSMNRSSFQLGELPSYDKATIVIPARGGSKGLLNKNILPIKGKPLIAYSIEAALQARTVDRVFVSIDSPDIAKISKEWGAEVPFLRPPELAHDTANVGDAINFTFNELYGEASSNVIRGIMYPTSPFRTPGLIDFLVGKILDGYSIVHTVKRIKSKSELFFTIRGGRLHPVLCDSGLLARGTYMRNYVVFAASRFCCPIKKYVYAIENEIMLIDIDTLDDFRLAEAVIENELFDFNQEKSPEMCFLAK